MIDSFVEKKNALFFLRLLTIVLVAHILEPVFYYLGVRFMDHVLVDAWEILVSATQEANAFSVFALVPLLICVVRGTVSRAFVIAIVVLLALDLLAWLGITVTDIVFFSMYIDVDGSPARKFDGYGLVGRILYGLVYVAFRVTIVLQASTVQKLCDGALESSATRLLSSATADGGGSFSGGVPEPFINSQLNSSDSNIRARRCFGVLLILSSLFAAALVLMQLVMLGADVVSTFSVLSTSLFSIIGALLIMFGNRRSALTAGQALIVIDFVLFGFCRTVFYVSVVFIREYGVYTLPSRIAFAMSMFVYFLITSLIQFGCIQAANHAMRKQQQQQPQQQSQFQGGYIISAPINTPSE